MNLKAQIGRMKMSKKLFGASLALFAAIATSSLYAADAPAHTHAAAPQLLGDAQMMSVKLYCYNPNQGNTVMAIPASVPLCFGSGVVHHSNCSGTTATNDTGLGAQAACGAIKTSNGWLANFNSTPALTQLCTNQSKDVSTDILGASGACLIY